MEEYLEAMSDDMAAALDGLNVTLSKVRTGRATPKLVDGVQVLVQSYGATMPLNQLATVQAPDARLLTVTPWDKTTISDIERGILAAGLGLNPSNDGQIIRVPVPALTQDRRKDLVKQVKTAAETSKVRVRQIRREYNEMFKGGEKDGDIGEDELHRLLAKVQETTDAFVKKIDDVSDAKEAEILEV